MSGNVCEGFGRNLVRTEKVDSEIGVSSTYVTSLAWSAR